MITSIEYAALRAIADEGSINRGARALGISVYRLRQRASAVEQRLGIALVDHARGRGGVGVTENLPRLLGQYEAMDRQVRDEIATDAPASDAPIRLGIMPTIGPQLVMAGYRRIEQIAAVPQTEAGIRTTTAFAAPPLEMLRNGTMDACIMAEPSYPDDMDRFQLANDPFVVAFPQGHPFEKMASVPLEALDDHPSINRSLCEFPRYLALKTGIVSPPQDATASLHSITDEMICQSLISEGAGVAVVPESLVLLQGVRSRRLTRPAISREISIVTRADSPLSARLRD
jgi:molybdate transport repressor ModE-like protein